MFKEPYSGLRHLIVEVFEVTHRHATLGRAPLDEGSARYHTTFSRHRHPCSSEIRTRNPSKRAVADRAATGTVCVINCLHTNYVSSFVYRPRNLSNCRLLKGRGVHRVLIGKPEGKRSLWRPWRRWEDNIKMDFQEVGGNCGDWMELAQDRDRWRALVGTVRNFRVPKMRGISWLAAETS